MSELGMYADGRTYDLPTGWDPVPVELAKQTLERAAGAFDDALERVSRYYDPATDYAGGLLTSLEPNPDYEVTPVDLFAVSTLSMKIPVRTTRALLRPGERRKAAHAALEKLPAGMSLTALDAQLNSGGAILAAMLDLQTELRTLPDASSNSWVFAAKTCARKRPRLFPVRDQVVCAFLNGGPLKSAGIGNFTTDIQVFAYLITSSAVTGRLTRLRDELREAGMGSELETSDLRLLDVVLWTAGVGHWPTDGTDRSHDAGASGKVEVSAAGEDR